MVCGCCVHSISYVHMLLLDSLLTPHHLQVYLTAWSLHAELDEATEANHLALIADDMKGF